MSGRYGETSRNFILPMPSDQNHIPIRTAYKSVAIADGVRLQTFQFWHNILASSHKTFAKRAKPREICKKNQFTVDATIKC